MDFESLKNQVSNLTLYDLKAGVRKVQNAVMNFTEMESKVREATNNEPWGASSTLMNEIAAGTFNYQLLNEIMPMIYKRFTEKAAEEWRQIYKALQLLEFLIKNGSERVIDDARSHVSLLKMLRQFHFIDQNGKDQGLNVRNRAKELAELLGDVDRIRQERKKARATKNKYGGVEGGMGMGGGFSSGGGSRYGGFGSESSGDYGGYSGGVYGDGGGFGGQEQSSYGDTQSHRDRFEEYDEGDAGGAGSTSKRADNHGASGTSRRAEAKKSEPAKPKEPEVDLFSFDDPPPAQTSNSKQPIASSNDFGALQSGGGDDDDFDDFQSAAPAASPAPPAKQAAAFTIPPPNTTATTTSATQFAAPQPKPGAQSANINNLFSSISPPPATSTPASNTAAFSPPQPTGYQAAQPNYFTSISVTPNQPTPPIGGPQIGNNKPAQIGGSKPAAKSGGGDAFSSLLSGTALSSKSGTPVKGMSIADMQKQKASSSMWGTSSGTSTPKPAGQQQQGGSSQFGDLI